MEAAIGLSRSRKTKLFRGKFIYGETYNVLGACHIKAALFGVLKARRYMNQIIQTPGKKLRRKRTSLSDLLISFGQKQKIIAPWCNIGIL